MHIRIAKYRSLHHAKDRVKLIDKERFDELRKGKGRAENDLFSWFEDEFYTYLNIKKGVDSESN